MKKCLGDETGKHTALKMLRVTPLWVRVPPEAQYAKERYLYLSFAYILWIGTRRVSVTTETRA